MNTDGARWKQTAKTSVRGTVNDSYSELPNVPDFLLS